MKQYDPCAAGVLGAIVYLVDNLTQKGVQKKKAYKVAQMVIMAAIPQIVHELEESE